MLENEAVVGSVNANRRHYEAGAAALAKADRSWLGRVVEPEGAARRVAAGARARARRREGRDTRSVPSPPDDVRQLCIAPGITQIDTLLAVGSG